MADIGTDHCALPVALVRSGAVPSAVAVDRQPGPLAVARRAARGLPIDVRLANGLRGLTPGEVDTVVIAGMGGHRICRIIGDATWPRRLVLQPRTDAPHVRATLQDRGWSLVEEQITTERTRFAVVLVYERAPPLNAARWGEDDLALGPLLRRERSEVFNRWLREEAARLDHEIRLAGAEASEQQRAGLRRVRRELEGPCRERTCAPP